MANLIQNTLSERTFIPIGGELAATVNAAKLLVAEKDITPTGTAIWTFPEEANALLLQVLDNPINIAFRSQSTVTEGATFKLNADGSIHLFVINPLMAIKVSNVAAGTAVVIGQFIKYFIGR